MPVRFAKSRLLVLGSLLFLWTVTCGALPLKENKGKAYPLPGSPQEVWKATMDILAEEKIPVHKSDESNGYIQTATFALYKKEYSRYAKKPIGTKPGLCLLEIGVTAGPAPDVTLLGIKAYFKRVKGLYLGGYRKKDPSRGIFETLLAGRINDRLLKSKYPDLSHTVIGCNFRFNEKAGLYKIAEVEEGGLAFEQGLREGDLLSEIDGKSVNPSNLFDFLITKQGETVHRFTLKRKGREESIDVSVFYLDPDGPKSGMTVERKNNRFMVTAVQADGPAAKAGVQAGDFLVMENNFELNGWKNYYRALASEKKGVPQNLVLDRGGRRVTATIVPS